MAWSSQTRGQIKCRTPGRLKMYSTPRPMELSHRTGWLCLTRVELEEAIEAVEDLLSRGSNNLHVSDSAYFVGLVLKSVFISEFVKQDRLTAAPSIPFHRRTRRRYHACSSDHGWLLDMAWEAWPYRHKAASMATWADSRRAY
jgi:hypothetical protein